MINAAPDYLERAKREAAAIAPHWPAGGYRLLDIGCGLGAVDAFLLDYCPITDIHLLDGTGPGKKEPYTDGSYAWNDVADAEQYVRGHCGTRVHTYPLDTPHLPDADMIISLRSWCHHYPAEVYLARVFRALQTGGRLVVDCRATTVNQVTLEASGFRVLAMLEQSRKRVRLLMGRA